MKYLFTLLLIFSFSKTIGQTKQFAPNNFTRIIFYDTICFGDSVSEENTYFLEAPLKCIINKKGNNTTIILNTTIHSPLIINLHNVDIVLEIDVHKKLNSLCIWDEENIYFIVRKLKSTGNFGIHYIKNQE